MDDPALRLAKAQAVIGAERALRVKAEHETRQLEVTRLRRAVVTLQRQAQAREKETTDAGA